MFNIIAGVIGVAIAVALIGATMFFGGDAFINTSSTAEATGLVNGAQQIGAAQALHRANNAGQRVADVDTLVTDSYLTSLPGTPANTGEWSLNTAGNVAFVPFNAGTDWTEFCDTIAGQANANDVTTVEDIANPTADELLDDGLQYNCVMADDAYAFAFRM